MKRRFLILPSLLLAGWLVHLLAGAGDSPVQPGTRASPPGPSESELAETRAQEHAVYVQQTRANIEQLARIEAERKNRALLDVQAQEARTHLQAAKSAAWTAVITTNWQGFQALRQTAATSRSGRVPCTLCNGQGVMDFCALCQHSGKCVSCNGTGKTVSNETCAACRGTGKCYLCFGSGRMPCPFCDDGMITLNLPPPPALMPVPGMVNPQHPQYGGLNQQNLARSAPSSHSVIAPSTSQSEAEPQAPRTAAAPGADDSSNLAWGLLILFAGIFAFHKLAPRIGRFLTSRSDPWAGIAVAANHASSEALVEHQSLSNFKDAFGGVPTGTVTQAEPGGKKDDSKPRSDLLNEVLDRTLKDLAIVRTFVSAIGRCSDESSRQKLLAGLSSEISTFKRKVNQPELLPIWQMAAALEGLLQQLTATPAHLTASTLRTVGSAVALLEALCIPGLKPDLATNPPVRFLAVDDDAISRRAVSSALKKALTEPDLAEGGEAALALAAQKSYDVIFLDVEMPGMDGFELCSKIHETELNRTTPVVFVTGHSDFKARAKSASTGGEDLIGKPFLAFELTVKALTLTLRGRLRTCEAAVQPAAQTVKGPHSRIVKDLSSTTPENHSQKSEDKKRSPTVPTVSLPPMPNHKNGVAAKNASRPAPAPLPAGPMPGDRNLSNGTAESRAPLDPFASEPSAAEFAQAFFTHAPIHLEELQNQLQMARNAPKPTDLSEFLGELYVGIHSLKADAERAELLALSRLSCSLEGMLKKLLESPKLCTPSTLDTAATAFELLVKLCRARSNPDLTRTPIHLLVVDDDPMARRAIGGALQLVFGKPESADSGEAALALAAEKPFDLIFLDVMMPGIDGFAACPKIHETGPNGQTPVVFVTSSDNQKSRSQAAGAGGCGFIPKPVLPSQITLTAWTFVLGNRLEKLKPAHVATQIEAALV